MLSAASRPEIWIVRHGETEWSLSGRHTGLTDIPLTGAGRASAQQIGKLLPDRSFSLVLTSPLERARETCRLAGYGDVAQVDSDLHEWDYGQYEGQTSDEIQQGDPGWNIWTSPVPGGESIDQVAARARRVLARACETGGHVLLFAHGHILRVMTACWLGLPPDAGRFFALGTASLGVLGYERDTRVISRWNLSS